MVNVTAHKRCDRPRHAVRSMDGYAGDAVTRPRAQRLDYNNAKAWRDPLRANRNNIAAAMTPGGAER